MTSLSFKIYVSSNLLVGAFFICIGLLPLKIESVIALVAVLASSFLCSIPAGFALYYIFAIVNFISIRVWLRWIAFLVLLSLAASIPYLFANGIITGELVNKDFQGLLFMSEGCAFGAVLLYCVPIHRFLKITSHENK